MTWCNPQQVRKVIGLTPDDVRDEDLYQYIEDAQRDVRDQIAVYQYQEELKGKIDGENTTFSTSFSPIADADFDLDVDTSDVEVWKWGDKDSIDTKETVTVSTIYPDEGKIVLSSPPASTYDCVVCNYYYYPRKIDTNRLPRVTALLAGYYYIMSEMLLIPEQWMHGAYRFRHARPYTLLLDEYYRELESLIGRRHVKEEHSTVSFMREEE